MIKVLLKPLLIFCLAYALLFLLLSLPGPKKVVAYCYRSMAGNFMPPVLPRAYLVFEQDPAMPDDPDRIRVRLQSREKVAEAMQLAREKGLKTIDLGFHTYNIFLFEFFVFPLLFFAALVIATPVPWKRKLIGLFFGLAFLHVFMLIKTYFITLYHLQKNEVPGYRMGAFGAEVVENIQLAFNNITTALITATLLWGIAVFRKGDWKKLIGRVTNPPRAQKKAPDSR